MRALVIVGLNWRLLKVIVPEVNVQDGYILITPPAGLFEINDENPKEPKDGAGDDA